MVEYVAQALKQTSREATILLYAPALDPHLQKMTELADRVFCFYEMPRAPAKGRAKAEPKMPGSTEQHWRHTHEMALEDRRPGRSSPGRWLDLKVLELQTAKEILAEVFHARPGEVEEMIQRRLVERSGTKRPMSGRRSARKSYGRRHSAWVD